MGGLGSLDRGVVRDGHAWRVTGRSGGRCARGVVVLGAGRGLGHGGLVLLPEHQEALDPVAEGLEHDDDAGHAAGDETEEHAPATGIEISKHVGEGFLRVGMLGAAHRAGPGPPRIGAQQGGRAAGGFTPRSPVGDPTAAEQSKRRRVVQWAAAAIAIVLLIGVVEKMSANF